MKGTIIVGITLGAISILLLRLCSRDFEHAQALVKAGAGVRSRNAMEWKPAADISQNANRWLDRTTGIGGSVPAPLVLRSIGRRISGETSIVFSAPDTAVSYNIYYRNSTSRGNTREELNREFFDAMVEKTSQRRQEGLVNYRQSGPPQPATVAGWPSYNWNALYRQNGEDWLEVFTRISGSRWNILVFVRCPKTKARDISALHSALVEGLTLPADL